MQLAYCFDLFQFSYLKLWSRLREGEGERERQRITDTDSGKWKNRKSEAVTQDKKKLESDKGREEETEVGKVAGNERMKGRLTKGREKERRKKREGRGLEGM